MLTVTNASCAASTSQMLAEQIGEPTDAIEPSSKPAGDATPIVTICSSAATAKAVPPTRNASSNE